MATRKNVKTYSKSGWTARTPKGAVQRSVRFHTRANGRKRVVRTEVTVSHVGRTARKVYSRMYEQEEKDIAKVVGVLEKYAN